ncbi:MAG: PKD domain-containing protein, partial [Thermoplasmata archaeon]|nr:PKD domain-containing protein [Thermoplasmata archaeon]
MGRWRGGASRKGAGALVTLVAAILVLILAPPSLAPGRSSAMGRDSSSAGSVIVAPAFVAGPGVRDLGVQPGDVPLNVLVGLAPAQSDALAARVALEYAPGSPEFHQFLSPAELAGQYGATPAAIDAATAYFEARGLTVTASPDRFLLQVAGPSSGVAHAFHTTFEQYQAGSQIFYNHPTAATLPASMHLYGVLGLGNATSVRPLVERLPGASARPSATCVGTGLLVPCQVYKAYNATALLNGGTNGTGYRIGVVDTYDGTQPQTMLMKDLKDFAQNYSLPVGPVRYLYPVPTTRNLNATSTSWGLEEALDLEWSRAMAPGATIDMTFAPDASTGLYASVDWLVAHHAVDVLSLSWGEPDTGIYNRYAGPCANQCNATSDGSYELLHPVLEAAIAEGIGVFVASGDCGAAYGTNGVATGYPSSDPAAVGVGGTDLTLNGNGGYGSETAWSGNASGAASPGCQNQGGSGGGYSPFPRPAWQRAPGLPNSPKVRGVPDVSIVGGTPVSIVYSDGLSGVAGTSESTPMWAGIAAIADQAHGGALGDLNPSLYQIARGTNPGRFIHDVTSGSNGYAAGTGWDPVTGLGSPNVGALVPNLADGAAAPSGAQVTLHATPRLVPLRAPVTFYLSTSNQSRGLAFYDVSFGDGNSSATSANNTTHAYATGGVFVARATAFDGAGNSSTSPPVAVVVGGGGAINVTLTVSNATPTTGLAVGFTVTVRNGLAPFTYTYDFGDGTYLANTSFASTSHAYGAAAAYCAAVVVGDSHSPQDGGASNRIAFAVGGARPIACDAPTPLSAQLIAPVPAADLPGDLPLTVMTTGGTPPFSVRYITDDPYVNACTCGIFSRPGNHTLTAFVNDSLDEQTIAQVNVTLYPALTGRLSASPTTGPAPLTVTFNARASGGHLANLARTNWSFGDGTTAVGLSVPHTYITPGIYVAIGSLSDLGWGNLSRAYVIDVLGGTPGGLVLAANVTPALRSPAGA